MTMRTIFNTLYRFFKDHLFLFFLFAFSSLVFGQVPGSGINVDLGPITSSQGFSSTVSLLVIMSMITLLPFFLITTTSFLRLIIVLGMLRQAMGTQQSPPSSVLIALSIFMTVFIMTPTINEIMNTSVKPYQAGELTQAEAMIQSLEPFRNFMIKFTRQNDMALFLEFSQVKYTDNFQEVPIFVIIPAFVLSELRAAFQISFLLFIPFLVIDLIISNILLSLGMFMLSPAMISLPFKILLFVLTDGWNLLSRGLLLSFQ